MGRVILGGKKTGTMAITTRSVTVADIIAQELQSRNAKLWAFTGGTLVYLFDACRRHKVKVVICRSEFGAGMAAIGAFKATGNLQFVAATSGPGATNLVTPIAEAYYDSCPIIFLTGQVGTSNLGRAVRQSGFQQTPIVSIVKPITKFAQIIDNPKFAESDLRLAIWYARERRMGPCLLDLPMNIQQSEMAPKVIS